MSRRLTAALAALPLALTLAIPQAEALPPEATSFDATIQLDGTTPQQLPRARQTRSTTTKAVTVDLIGRDGKPGIRPSEAVITDLDHPTGFYFAEPGEVLDLPPGRYAAAATIYSPIPGQWMPALTTVASPEFRVDTARHLTLDARPGQPVTLQVDRPDAQIIDQRLGVRLNNSNGTHYSLTAGGNSQLYAVPTDSPQLDWYLQAQVEKPQGSLTVTAPDRFKVPVEWALEQPRLAGRHDLAMIDVGHALPTDLRGKDLRGKLAVFTLSPAEADQYGVRVQALAKAGAKAAVLYLTEILKFSTKDGTALPVLLSIGPEGSRLARTGARVSIEGIDASPYHYELAFPHRGGIPHGRNYHPANRDLAAVHTSFHALGNDRWASANTYPVLGDLEMHDFSPSSLAGTTQTQYFSPAPITWSRSWRSGQQVFRPQDTTFTKGHSTEHWAKAVLAPSLPTQTPDGQPPATRTADTLRINIPLRSDSAGNSGFVGEDNSSFGDQGETRLYADGRLLGRTDTPGLGTFQVPAKPTTYRLVTEVTRTLPELPLSNKVIADWTFHSAGGQSKLPLPTIGFDPKLDLQNSAPAGRAFTFPVTSSDTLTSVEASYDNGATWHTAVLRKNGSAWSATVTHPKTAGFVSLRAEAKDAQGNKAVISVLQAYRLTH
jgi:hypothetical protein